MAQRMQHEDQDDEWIYGSSDQDEGGASGLDAAEAASRRAQSEAASTSDESEWEGSEIARESRRRSGLARARTSVSTTDDATSLAARSRALQRPAETSAPATSRNPQASSSTRQLSSPAPPQLPPPSATIDSSSTFSSLGAQQRSAPHVGALLSYFGEEADTWKSASRAPLIFKDGSNINRCAWRLTEGDFIEEAEVCHKNFSTGEALVQHIMAKHVRPASRRFDGKIRLVNLCRRAATCSLLTLD